jgi:hypothetical protein
MTDLAKINSNAHRLLARAQEDMHAAIEAFGQAADEHAEAECLYREALADATKALREAEKQMPATDREKLARGTTARLKKESMAAADRKKKAQYLIMSIEHRMNNVKYIGRRTDAMADNYQGD